MQAAGHWRVLAEDTADRIMKALEDREDLLLIPMYLTPPDDRPFSLAFNNLLTSSLVSRGMQVSLAEEAENIDVSYNVYAVKHSERFQRPPLGTFTLLASGISAASTLSSAAEWITAGVTAGVLTDLGVGAVASESQREVVISIAMSHNNRFVVHHSSVYYIHDPDVEQYIDPLGGGHQIDAFGPRPVRVVNQ